MDRKRERVRGFGPERISVLLLVMVARDFNLALPRNTPIAWLRLIVDAYLLALSPLCVSYLAKLLGHIHIYTNGSAADCIDDENNDEDHCTYPLWLDFQ